MAPTFPEDTVLDEAAITIGLSIVLVGVAVMGFLETVLGTADLAVSIPGLGVIPVRTAFSPHVQASLIALGFCVLFVRGLFRVARTVSY